MTGCACAHVVYYFKFKLFFKNFILIYTFKRLTMDLRTRNTHILFTHEHMITIQLSTNFDIYRHFLFEIKTANRVNLASKET